jgi:hypothetical protein
MTSARLLGITILTAVLVTTAMGIVLISGTAALRGKTNVTRTILTTNPLVGHPHRVDRLATIDTPGAFAAGEMKDVKLDAAQLTLHDTSDNYPRRGWWTSPEMRSDFAFTELLPSWNASCPPDTGVAFHLRTRDARSGQWSPWLYLGQWGRIWLSESERLVRFDDGAVHTDILMLDRPADAWQVRAKFHSFSPQPQLSPGVRRIAIAYSGRIDDDAQRRLLTDVTHINGQWARSLPVPFRTQLDAPRPLAEMICSPTSVAMVMEYFGTSVSTLDNAMATYDHENLIFGNWGRAVQRAAELGFDAWLARFQSLEQVKSLIAQGLPLIINIKFKEGEFPSCPYKSSGGHLLVIRGFTADGDVICNDPYVRDKGDGIVYKAGELTRAWLDNSGGVGYVLRTPRQPPAP